MAPHSLVVLTSPFAHPISHQHSQFSELNVSLLTDQEEKQNNEEGSFTSLTEMPQLCMPKMYYKLVRHIGIPKQQRRN